MTEPPEPTRPSDVTRLLSKAVKALPEDEQRIIYEYFFEQGMRMPQPPSRGQVTLHAPSAALPFAGPATTFHAQKPVGPEQVMIPVRLPEAQHKRLKEWCAEHNFPMAVVVRGLIDRFLDSWEARPER